MQILFLKILWHFKSNLNQKKNWKGATSFLENGTILHLEFNLVTDSFSEKSALLRLKILLWILEKKNRNTFSFGWFLLVFFRYYKKPGSNEYHNILHIYF